jgi:hypothetical protein
MDAASSRTFNLVNAMAVDPERGPMHAERKEQPDSKSVAIF